MRQSDQKPARSTACSFFLGRQNRLSVEPVRRN
jgi:hypothetical protein